MGVNRLKRGSKWLAIFQISTSVVYSSSCDMFGVRSDSLLVISTDNILEMTVHRQLITVCDFDRVKGLFRSHMICEYA